MIIVYCELGTYRGMARVRQEKMSMKKATAAQVVVAYSFN